MADPASGSEVAARRSPPRRSDGGAGKLGNLALSPGEPLLAHRLPRRRLPASALLPVPVYVGADGRVALLTRSADLRRAQMTSEHCRKRSRAGRIEIATPIAALRPCRAMLQDLGARGRSRASNITVAHGLTHFHGLAEGIEAALADLVDARRRVPSRQRSRAYPSQRAELACVREAARLSDLADRAAIDGDARRGRRRRDPRGDA